MKISMHNRMRAEPLEVTVARLARCGYDAIEISGEPARYDPREVRPLLERHGVCCCVSVTLMTDGLDLISPDPAVRQNSVQNIMDRTPLGAQQYGDASVVGVSDDKFLRDHASGDVSAEYYDRCVERTIAHLRRFL